jgi:hypothetical protein
MAKYGNDVFQKAMTEYYSQPTAHKDNVAGKIPNTVNVAPKGTAQTAKAARAGSAASEAMTVTSKVSKVGKALPRVGMALMFIDAGIQMWQLADSLSRINSYYPKNFTLFDYLFLRRINNALVNCGDNGIMQPVLYSTLITASKNCTARCRSPRRARGTSFRRRRNRCTCRRDWAPPANITCFKI